MNARWHILIVLNLVLSLVQLGCDNKDEDVTSNRSSVKVQLPAKPDLKKPTYKRVHGDGVLTVEGRGRGAHGPLGPWALSPCPQLFVMFIKARFQHVLRN